MIYRIDFLSWLRREGKKKKNLIVNYGILKDEHVKLAV